MSWVRLDDGMPDNLKIEPLSDAAFRAYVTSICYAARNLTDGFVTAKKAKEFTGKPRIIQELVPHLWGEVEGGYLIHDFLTYNPTRESVLKRRAEDSARKSRRIPAGKSADSKRPRARDPRPDPDPDPQDPPPSTHPSQRARAEPPAVEDRSFSGQYVWHQEQRKGRHPGGAAVAAAEQLEREFGREACLTVASDLSWEKHPNYMRPILEERKKESSNGRTAAPQHASTGRRRSAVPAGPDIEGWERYARGED